MGLFSSILSTILKSDVSKGLGNLVNNTMDVLQGPVANELTQAHHNVKELQYMAEKLPMFPLWTVGGRDFDIYGETGDDGSLCYRLTLKGTQQMLDSYKQLLLAHGFRYANDGARADVMSKMINGECYACIYTDAVTDDEVSVLFEKNIEYWP